MPPIVKTERLLYFGIPSCTNDLSMNELKNGRPARGWNAYWQGAADARAYTPSEIRHSAFPTFWSTALGEFIVAHPDAQILDIGTGSGAVIRYLSRVPEAKLGNVSCVDVAQGAINAVQRQFPDVNGVVADATSIPFETGRFSLITSQFGIEYAGPAAIDEALRLLGAGGSLLFLLHIRPGELYRECEAAIDALQRARQCGFVGLALDYFEKGFAAVRGADRAPYESAARLLNPAIGELEAIMTEHGEHVAGDMISYLHSTVQAMHKRIQHYDPGEALGWLRSMEEELAFHHERMESMRNASMSEDAFKQLCEKFNAEGLMVENAAPLVMKSDELPVAWVLHATRPV